MRYLSLILKNCLRNRRRSFLTITSLAISLCLLGILLTLYYVIYLADVTPEQALRLVTRHKVSITMVMPLYYRERIRTVPGVREVMTYQWFGGWYKNEERDQSNFFPRFGAEPEQLFKVYSEWKIPEDQKKAFIADRGGCVIGRTTARKQGLNIGDRVFLRGNIFPIDVDLIVRGIYDSPVTGDDGLWFHLAQIEEGLKKRGSNRSFAGTFYIVAQSTDDVPRIPKLVDDMFANSEAPTRTETEQAFALSFLAFLGNIKLILLSICAAVTFTILLISANTVAMSVRERVREVGVLKTLGFSQGTVLWLLLAESVIIALIGGALGLGLAQGLLRGIAEGAGSFIPPDQSAIHLPVALALMGVSLFIGVVSSAIPAYNASRTEILEALRFTD